MEKGDWLQSQQHAVTRNVVGTTILHLSALPVPLLRQVYVLIFVGVFLLVSFLECFLCAQRGLKGFPKWSKIDQKGVQKRHLKKGTKKVPKIWMFSTPECGQSAVNNSKIDEFHVLVLGPFWVSFGGVFGAQMEAKSMEKWFPKVVKKHY